MDPNEHAAGADAGQSPPPAAPQGAYSAADAQAAAAQQPPAAAAPPPLHERVPEKYRVQKDDGTFDLEASVAKLLDGHSELEKAFGSRKVAPKSPDEYDPKVDGFDFAALKEDPQYQSFLKGAHAKGVDNDLLSWILGEYAARESAQPSAMTAAEFQQTMMAEHWKSEAEYNAGMQAGLRVIRSYMPDITAEELASIPNSPTVSLLLAKIAADVGEDRLPKAPSLSAADFDTQLAALQSHPAYMDGSHPEHAAVVKKMEALFQQRYPTQKTA